MTRPLPSARAAVDDPPPGSGAAAASSTIAFQAPQASHFPCQRDDTAPQAWQTKEGFGRAMRSVELRKQGVEVTSAMSDPKNNHPVVVDDVDDHVAFFD